MLHIASATVNDPMPCGGVSGEKPRAIDTARRRAYYVSAKPLNTRKKPFNPRRWTMSRSIGRIALAAALAVLIAGTATVVRAQAPAPGAQAPAPPPTWKQGQPAELATSPLAPVPQPPAPLAAEKIPLSKIKVPPGFKVELYASGINNARAMTLGSKGTLFVSSRVAGNVYALTDKGGKKELKTLAKGLDMPNGVTFRNGTLYVAAQNRILKWDGIEDKLDNPGEPVVVI